MSLLPGSPTRPPWKEMPFSRTLLYISFWFPSKGAHLPGSLNRAPIGRDAPFQSPNTGASFMFPLRGPYGERCSVSRASGLFIHLCLSESPEKSPPMKWGKTVTVHGSPQGWKAYIQWGAAWYPKEIVNTAITTPVPCSLQHNTFHLGLVRPEPH